MGRLAIEKDTYRALFAKSGNCCAFPGCPSVLVTDRNLFVAQICHIEAANPGWPRHNPDSNDEERRNFRNLILLCYPHHKEIDSSEEMYTVKSLAVMKAEHESANGQKLFKVDESVIYRLERDMEAYWSIINKLSEERSAGPDLSVHVETKGSPISLFKKIQESVQRLQEFTDLLHDMDEDLDNNLKSMLSELGYSLAPYLGVKYYENPFIQRNWEIHNLGIRNAFIDLQMLLLQIEIKYIEEYLKTHPDDEVVKLRFEEAKRELTEFVKSVEYSD